MAEDVDREVRPRRSVRRRLATRVARDHESHGMSTIEPLDPLAAITSLGIPPRPSPQLDRVLDATERCLARHGVRRTTMSDIANEMGVSRPTLYKHLASVEEAIVLVAARQLYELLDQLSTLLEQGAHPQTFIDMAIGTVTFVRSHPVTERVLTYEPDLVGKLITAGQLATYTEQIVDLVAPLLRAAMDAGTVRSGDPRLMAELIIRLCGSLLLTPTAANVEELVQYTLEPHLIPDRPRNQRNSAPHRTRN